MSPLSYVRTYLKQLDSKSNSYGDCVVALEHSSPDCCLFALHPIALRVKNKVAKWHNGKTETGKRKMERKDSKVRCGKTGNKTKPNLLLHTNEVLTLLVRPLSDGFASKGHTMEGYSPM